MVHVWVVLEVDLSLGSGGVWYVVPINVGLSVPDATGVLNPVFPSSMVMMVAHQHIPGRVPFPPADGGSAPALGSLLVPGLVFGPLGKAPAPEGGRTPPTGRMLGFGSPSPGLKALPPGAGVGFRDSPPSFPSPG